MWSFFGSCSFAVHVPIDDQLEGYPLTKDEIYHMKENIAKLSKEEELEVINLKEDELRKFEKLLVRILKI